ncbi:MAG: serine hydrolase [Nitrospira sp.]|nr:serine hydrolase [Nitrospira sp.]
MGAVLQALERAVHEKIFPGAVVLVRSRGTVVFHEAVGTRGTPPDDQPVHLESIYDLASLTKPLATSTAMLCLVRDGHLHLDQLVSEWVAELEGSPFAGVDLRQLLSHQAGLPAWRPYYEQLAPSGLPPRNEEERRQRLHALLNAIASEPIEYQPGSQSLYSDLGFMSLGVIVERCTGTSLAAYCRRSIYEPLGIAALSYISGDEDEAAFQDPTKIVPTEWDRWRNRLLCGEVHDENAYALGGSAGHAGLFGTAHAVSQLSAAWLQAVQGRDGVLSAALAKQFTHRQSDISSWGLGWDTPSVPSSSGTRFSSRAFGHVGFTGTSLWIDPSCDLEVIILSNRVHPTRTNPAIKAFRPQIHDAIYQEWGGR